MPRSGRNSSTRCGHFDQRKIGRNWKCVSCGQIMTVRESIQNDLELSEVLRSSIDSRRSLTESLDEVLGRREWDEMRTKIPYAKKGSKERVRRS